MFETAGILTPFEVEASKCDWDISYQIVDALTPPSGSPFFQDPGKCVYKDGDVYISYIGSVGRTLKGAYIRAERKGNQSSVEVRRSALVDRINSKVALTAMEAEHMVVCGGGFLLHSSFVEYQGSAILFTALSGTGKSTQAELWRKYRNAEIINGDRSVVRKGEYGFEAVGVPFSGSSGISKSRRLPLRAIVYLDQASESTIVRVSSLKAFRLIWEGCTLHTWNAEDVARCSQTVMDAVTQIPVYYLACTPDESAVIALEQVLESR